MHWENNTTSYTRKMNLYVWNANYFTYIKHMTKSTLQKMNGLEEM